MLTLCFTRSDESARQGLPPAHARYAKALRPFVSKDPSSHLSSLFLRLEVGQPHRIEATDGLVLRSMLLSDLGVEITVGGDEHLVDYDGAVIPTALLEHEPLVVTLHNRPKPQRQEGVELDVVAQNFKRGSRHPIQTLRVSDELRPEPAGNMPKASSWVVDVDLAAFRKALRTAGSASLDTQALQGKSAIEAYEAGGRKGEPPTKTSFASVRIALAKTKPKEGEPEGVTLSVTPHRTIDAAHKERARIDVEGVSLVPDVAQTRRSLDIGIMSDLFLRALGACTWKRARITFGTKLEAVVFRPVPEALVSEPDRAGDLIVGMPMRWD